MDIMWCMYQFGVRSDSKYKHQLAEWKFYKNQKVTSPGVLDSDTIPENQQATEAVEGGRGCSPQSRESDRHGEDANETVPEKTRGPRRTRGQKMAKPSCQRATGDTSLAGLFELDYHLHATSEAPQSSLQIQPNLFQYHERVLHSVDSFLHGLFGSRKKGWSADTIGFVDGQGTLCALTDKWRDVLDQCHSITVLARSNLTDKAEKTLDQLLQGIDELFEQPHPAFVAQFWRICLRLLSMDCHLPRVKPIDRLFAQLLQSQAATAEQTRSSNSPSPIQLLVDSLRRIDRRQLKHVLRIGYVKTILTLTELIGDENIAVLEMLIFYCRFFASQHLGRQLLLNKLDYVWPLVHSSHGEAATASIAISYSFAYAAYYVCDAPYLALGMAKRLREHYRSLACRPLCGALEHPDPSILLQLLAGGQDLPRAGPTTRAGIGERRVCKVLRVHAGGNHTARVGRQGVPDPCGQAVQRSRRLAGAVGPEAGRRRGRVAGGQDRAQYRGERLVLPGVPAREVLSGLCTASREERRGDFLRADVLDAVQGGM